MHFHLLCFEGPDPYARAGGLATRIDGLSRCLAGLGFEPHLWFVGDPDRPAYEEREGVHLHRWCQWLSREHRGGVYEGEEAKCEDYARSLPPVLVDQMIAPVLAGGGKAVVMAEEWQTVGAVLDIDRRLRERGLRQRVPLLWNANNLFGFERVPWPELMQAAVITTVSRFMRLRMETRGVEPLVIANGLPSEAYRPPERSLLGVLRRQLLGRTVLVKVARWDPDKSWLTALRSAAALRDNGAKPPLLVARGGREAHEREVRAAASSLGLRWTDRSASGDGAAALRTVLEDVAETDVACLRFPLGSADLRGLYRVADAVLADSRFEPFGLVGLEAMAAGGIACTRLTGEDYVVPGRNALVLQTEDPRELGALLQRLREYPAEEREVRRNARATARWFAWEEIVKRVLLPRLELLRRP